MEFSFSEQQEELRRSARRFLASASAPARVRGVMETELGYEPAVWTQLSSELGWTGVTIPEAYGGLGMGYLDLYPLMEEMGRALLCSPFLSSIGLGANALLLGGNEDQKERHLPEIAAGELTATLAYVGPRGRWDAATVEASYHKNNGGFLLSGTKGFVIDGHTADLLIVAARQPHSHGREGVSLFLVPADTTGVYRTWLPTVDQTRRLAKVELDDVYLPDDALLGAEGAGWPLCERIIDRAIAALAAEQVGASERCLEMAVEHAKTRTQFGRPIGSFQAIKHKCADMLMAVESARSAAFYATALAARHDDGLAEAAAAAKAFCSNALFECAAENIQIHGGIGFTWEHDAQLYFKRAKSSETLFGDATHHRARFADLVGL